MVNNRILIVSRYKSGLPDNWGGMDEREISSGPLYPKTEILKLVNELRAQTEIKSVTKKSRDDIANLGYENTELFDVITLALTEGHYKNSVWCKCSEKTAAACDAYTFTDRAKSNDWPLYLKFAIAKERPNILIVSLHYADHSD